MIQATDILFANKTANAFVKEELRREFQQNRTVQNPRVIRRQLAQGHEVLETMVSLIQRKPEFQEDENGS